VRWIATAGVLAWFLLLPLRDVFAYPDRISVLPNLETDAAAYDAFARDFAGTWDIGSLPSKHPPGWMVVLAGVYSLFSHSYVAGKLVSWMALVLVVALCAWLADRVYGRTAGLIAAVLCASSPGLRGYVGTLQYEVLTGALFALFLVLAIRALDATSRRDRLQRAALAGLAGAMLVLTRETFVLVVPLTAAWVWWRLRDRAADRATSAFATAAVMTMVAAAPAVIWSAAQTLHYGRLILISEKGPKEFELGNNPLANGTYNEPLVGVTEPLGVEFIRAFPLQALRLAARKLLYCFGVLRDGWNVPHPAAVWLWRATTGAVPLEVIEPIVRGGWLLLTCALALMQLGRHGWRQWWVLPATVMAILLVHLITIGSYRFAVPLLPVLYVMASGPLSRAYRVVAPSLRNPIPGATLTVLVLAGVAAQYLSWPLSVSYRAADLEGLAAANSVDEVSGLPARLADARRGPRPVVILPDTFLPKGSVRLTVKLRNAGGAVPGPTTVSRVALTQLNGRSACIGDVTAAQLTADSFRDTVILCDLDRDGPATLAVHSLGQVDLSVDSVSLAWTK
jgi:4-amino-4-deoxy-L-arabinose transferase-like glycosyltransferase